MASSFLIKGQVFSKEQMMTEICLTYLAFSNLDLPNNHKSPATRVISITFGINSLRKSTK